VCQEAANVKKSQEGAEMTYSSNIFKFMFFSTVPGSSFLYVSSILVPYSLLSVSRILGHVGLSLRFSAEGRKSTAPGNQRTRQTTAQGEPEPQEDNSPVGDLPWLRFSLLWLFLPRYCILPYIPIELPLATPPHKAQGRALLPSSTKKTHRH
jgi:hypothetical protein